MQLYGMGVLLLFEMGGVLYLEMGVAQLCEM